MSLLLVISGVVRSMSAAQAGGSSLSDKFSAMKMRSNESRIRVSVGPKESPLQLVIRLCNSSTGNGKLDSEFETFLRIKHSPLLQARDCLIRDTESASRDCSVGFSWYDAPLPYETSGNALPAN